MTFILSKQKVKDLLKECKKVRQLDYIPIQKLAFLIEKISAMISVVFPAKLKSRALFRDKNRELKRKG